MRYTTLPLTLRQLQYVVAVAETKSFRRAAERCHVSQPSLSAQVAELEASLDVRLFERNRKTVMTTPAGEALLVRAHRVLLDAEDLAETARRFVDPLTGALRIGVIPTIGPYLLPVIDPALRAAFPRLTLVWTEEKTEVLVERIKRGELDAALVALEAELGDLEHFVIGRDPFVLAVAERHPLARTSRSVRLSDLENEEALLLDDGHCFRDQTLKLCAFAGAKELGFRATSLPTLAHMVAAGNAITLLPRLALEVENRNALLAIRPFAEPVPFRTVVLAYRRQAAMIEALRAVTETARLAFGRATGVSSSSAEPGRAARPAQPERRGSKGRKSRS